MLRRLVILIALCFSQVSFAYQQGDTLSAVAEEQLNLNQDALTIVDFFAEWCVSCRHELPEVNELYQELEGTGITVVGVDVDEDIEVGRAFQKSLGLSFPVINDTEQTLIGDFKPIGMPALYYLYQGQVIKVRFGAINDIREVILSDLREMGVEI